MSSYTVGEGAPSMTTDGTQSVSLRYYLQVLRQRAWIVLLCGVLGAGAAMAALATLPVRATATAAVSAAVISADPFSPSRPASGLIDPAGEALVADSFIVAERAAQRLGGGYTADQIREGTEAIVVADTTVLRISATAGSAQQAREMADAVAVEYLNYRSEQAQDRIARTLQKTSDRLTDLRGDLAEVDATLLEADQDSLERAQAETDRSMLTLEINAVLAEAASTQNIDTTGGSVLTPAAANRVSYSPSQQPVLVTGALAGLGLGVLAAFLVNAMNSRVRGSREVVESGGRKVLGDFHARHATVPASGEDLEDFRALRERVLSEPSVAARTGVLAVMDEAPGGLGDDVAVNLALVLGSSGVTVEYLRLGATQEQVEVLVDRLALSSEEQGGQGRWLSSELVPHLTVYVPPTEDQMIVDEPLSRTVRRELAERKQSALVVMHAPPGTSEATRLAAGRVSDCAILVAARSRTRTSTLERTTQDVRRMGTPILGTVLVSAHRDSGVVRPKALHAGEPAQVVGPAEPPLPVRDHQPSDVDR